MQAPFVFSAKLFFAGKGNAKIALESLKVELGEKFEKRAQTKISVKGETVFVQIDALDQKSLKASVNNYLKLFLLSEKILEVC